MSTIAADTDVLKSCTIEPVSEGNAISRARNCRDELHWFFEFCKAIVDVFKPQKQYFCFRLIVLSTVFHVTFYRRCRSDRFYNVHIGMYASPTQAKCCS